jgi:hypothetical protein
MSELQSVTVNPPRPGSPRRRIYWLFGLAAIVLCGLAAPLLYYVVTAEQSLQRALEEADRTDPGWRINDIEENRRVVPDDQNMGDVVIAVKKVMPPAWPCWFFPQLAKNTEFSGDELQRVAASFDDLEPQYRLGELQIRMLRAEVKRAQPAVQEALKILQTTHGRFALNYGKGFNIIGTLIPHTQETREVANVLGALAKMRAQDGDADGALTACRALMLTQRAVGDEPFLVSVLVRIAVRAIARQETERTLAQGEPTEPALVAMQKLMEEELEDNMLLTGARGERAVGEEVMTDFQNDLSGMPQKIKLLRGLSAGGSVSVMNLESLSLLIPGAAKSNRAAMLRFNNRVVALAREPVEKHADGFAELEKFGKRLPPLARILAGAVAKVGNAYRRDVGQMRSAVVMIATERYRRAEGHWPAALTDLVPKYLSAVPLDPIDSAPLRVRHLSDGLVIYSIADNKQDDGGAVRFDSTRGRGVAGGQFPDWGYRLWDVKARRQPPKPLRVD